MNSKYCTYDPVNKILSGKPRQQIYNIDANLGYLILQKLIQNPQNVCQILADNGTELKNSDMYERSLKFANHFKELGLKQRDVAGLITMNTENLVPIIIACLTLGIAVNPLSTVMDEDDIVHMWSKLKPKVIFSHESVAGTVKNAIDSMKLEAKIYTIGAKAEGFDCADDILNTDYDARCFE